MTQWPGSRQTQRTRVGPDLAKGPCMLLTILIIVLLVSLVGGGFGHSRFGYAGWSPAGIIICVLLVLMFTGRLHG